MEILKDIPSRDLKLALFHAPAFFEETTFERPSKPYLPIDQNGISSVKIKLLERGIKKSFMVTSEKVILVN